MNFKYDKDEQRVSVRVDFNMPVEISCLERGAVVTGALVNLSIHGMLLELQDDSVPVAMDKEKTCMARLIFQGKASKLVIEELQLTIVRFEKNMLALEFCEPLEWFLLFTVYKNKQTHNT